MGADTNVYAIMDITIGNRSKKVIALRGDVRFTLMMAWPPSFTYLPPSTNT